MLETSSGGRLTLTVLVPLPGAPQVAAARQPVLFVVDDEPTVATFMTRVLVDAGYRVETFTDPAAALAAFRADPWQVDLVITDQSMPDISGDVLMSSMLEQRPGLPVIICTGYTLDLGSRAALELGAAGYLGKPVAVPELRQLVTTGLARG